MWNRRFAPGRTIAIISLVGALTVCASGRATTVVPMNLQTLADHAGQVILGEVSAVRSYWATAPRRIESEVTFHRVEYLKGAPAGGSKVFTLVVPGGTIGRMQMRVAGAPVFQVGQRWLVCLLPTYRTFPVVGIWRGAFRIVTDAAGVDRILDAFGAAVTRIDADGFVRVASPPARTTHKPVIETKGVRVQEAPSASSFERAMDRVAFLNRFRPILAQSRDHKLTEPAGKPAPIVFRAVALDRRPGPARRATETTATRSIAAPRAAHLPRRLKSLRRGTKAGRRGTRP